MPTVDRRSPLDTDYTPWLHVDAPDRGAEAHPWGGKWLVFLPAAEVEARWAVIREATAAGELGSAAKVATSPSQRYGSHPVCVYTRDCRDTAEVARVLGLLRALGFRGRLSYKEDAATLAGTYGAGAALYVAAPDSSAFDRRREPVPPEMNVKHCQKCGEDYDPYDFGDCPVGGPHIPTDRAGTIYVLCFGDTPIHVKSADLNHVSPTRHYVGWTGQPARDRVRQHGVDTSTIAQLLPGTAEGEYLLRQHGDCPRCGTPLAPECWVNVPNGADAGGDLLAELAEARGTYAGVQGDARQATCPRCGAAAGVKCTTTSGRPLRPAGDVHSDRARAAGWRWSSATGWTFTPSASYHRVTCEDCGGVTYGAADEVPDTCEHCGATWDSVDVEHEAHAPVGSPPADW